MLQDGPYRLFIGVNMCELIIFGKHSRLHWGLTFGDYAVCPLLNPHYPRKNNKDPVT